MTFISEHTHKGHDMQVEAHNLQEWVIPFIVWTARIEIGPSGLVASTVTVSLDPVPSSSMPVLFHCLAHVLTGRGIQSQFLLHKQRPALHLRIVCGQDCSQSHDQKNLISWGFPGDSLFFNLPGLRSVKKKTKCTKGLRHHRVTLLRESKIKCRMVADRDWHLHRH